MAGYGCREYITDMNGSKAVWPVCSLEGATAKPDAAWIVIFGASGDLARRKIFPALFDLDMDGILPRGVRIVGFARRGMDDAAFRAEMRTACAEHARHAPFDETQWSGFESRISYLAADLNSIEGYGRLARIIAGETAGDRSTTPVPSNALFYLAVGPELFAPIAARLGEAGLGSMRSDAGGAAGWRRLVVEKPYGKDRAGANALTAILRRSFDEKDIFRIDHYLGKETVQNLLYLRFANAIFEPLWNRNHIESVDISVFETVGVGGRGGYYDGAGAARDMLQNHLVQLLCLVAMEPPAGLEPENIRDEKVKVLKCVPDYTKAEFLARSLRGQYTAGFGPGSEPVPAYAETDKVRSDSRTETFAALRLELDNWRFSGVPFTLRTGKALDRKISEITIRFKQPPATLFAAHCGDDLAPNVLTIRIQPEEGVWMTFNAKVPGRAAVKPNELRFSYREGADYFPEAYERLLADALAGDSTLFIRADESEQSWRIVDAMEATWASAGPGASPSQGGLIFYPAGSAAPDFPLGRNS